MRTYQDHRPTFQSKADWSLPEVLRARATSHGDRIYLDEPSSGRTYTYQEMLVAAESIGSGLLRRGCNPGDRVVILAPNSAEYILAWFGTAMAGLVEVPVNTAYRGTFLDHQLWTVQPAAAIVGAELAQSLVESSQAGSSIRDVYVIGNTDDTQLAVDLLRKAGWQASDFASLLLSTTALPHVSPHALGSIFFTSGTTGPSKGVMMPHSQMYFFADECVSLTRLQDSDTYLSVGPLFHGNAQFLAAFPALIKGARFVLRERFSASQWVPWIRESEATVTNFVGVMMDFVWRQPPTTNDRDNSLRCVFAAPTASSILDQFKTRFNIDAFVEVFGLTETSMPIMTPYAQVRPPGAAGLLVEDWFEVRLVNPETDEEVEPGEMGELIVRPRQPWTTSAGYFAMPDRTAEAFRNLWFHTGDGLRQDAEGWFYFVDRLKDAIRRRGENISSFEVEQAFIEHPSIVECAAIGVPADGEASEDEVMLFVVPRPGHRLSFEDVWSWAEKRLPYFAVPRYVQLVDLLPKTPSAKVMKAELRSRGIDAGTADRRLLDDKKGNIGTR